MVPDIMAQLLSYEEAKELLTRTEKFYDSIDKMSVPDIADLTYPAH